MQLVHLSSLKGYLNIAESNIQYDVMLAAMIEQVSQQIETALNRWLEFKQRTQVFHGGSIYCNLRAYPIVIDDSNPFSLNLATYGQTPPIANMTQNVDYFVDIITGTVQFLVTPLEYPNILTITYSGGYAADSSGVLQVPDDLKRACIMQCAYIYKQRNNDGITQLHLSDGGQITIAPSGLLKGVEQIIEQYRNMGYIDGVL